MMDMADSKEVSVVVKHGNSSLVCFDELSIPHQRESFNRLRMCFRSVLGWSLKIFVYQNRRRID